MATAGFWSDLCSHFWSFCSWCRRWGSASAGFFVLDPLPTDLERMEQLEKGLLPLLSTRLEDRTVKPFLLGDANAIRSFITNVQLSFIALRLMEPMVQLGCSLEVPPETYISHTLFTVQMADRLLPAVAMAVFGQLESTAPLLPPQPYPLPTYAFGPTTS